MLFITIFLATSVVITSAFAPSIETVRTSSTYLQSSALIIQNKGGGHGELGLTLSKQLSTNPKITSITILQDDACNDEKEPFVSYSSDIPDVNIVKANLADEEMTADDMKKLLGDKSFDYVWDNCSKGAVGAGKAVIDCAMSWDSKLLTYVSSAGIYQPDDVVSIMYCYACNIICMYCNITLFK